MRLRLRLSMIDQLEPYLKHLGTCPGNNLCAIDEKCNCGLRGVYHKLTIVFAKMQSVVRYLQRIDHLRDSEVLSDNNMYRARELAREL